MHTTKEPSKRLIVKQQHVSRCMIISGVLLLLAFLGGACASRPRNCMENIPRRVKGLTVVSGPREKNAIIRDMVSAVCNGRVLFNRMMEAGEPIKPGRVVFRVVVEYTGEVYGVTIEESTISSKKFLREVSDFIMDTDFVFWGRSRDDTVFLYPVRFGG